MDRVVTYMINGEEMRMKVSGTKTDQEARQAVIDSVAKTFHVVAVTTIRPRQRRSLLSTYIDGFRTIGGCCKKNKA